MKHAVLLMVLILSSISTIPLQTITAQASLNPFNQDVLDASIIVYRPDYSETVLNVNCSLQANVESLDVYYGVIYLRPNSQVRNMWFDTKVLNDTKAATVTFSQVMPKVAWGQLEPESEYKGTWTIAVMVFAADRVTPLAVATQNYSA